MFNVIELYVLLFYHIDLDISELSCNLIIKSVTDAQILIIIDINIYYS